MQALDSGNVQGVATQYQQKCGIAWSLFPGRYAQWAQAALPDGDLEQISTEMARWTASTAAQQLHFSQAEESAAVAHHPPASLANPSLAVPLSASPDSSPIHESAASDGISGSNEATTASASEKTDREKDEEDSMMPDEEEDAEQVRHEHCSFLLAFCSHVR